MAAYKFYTKEQELFPEAYATKVSDGEAIKIVAKLAHHFKKKYMYVVFYGEGSRGNANPWSGKISLAHNPSIGLIAHEVGHIVTGKDGGRWHSKKLLRKIKVINNYMKRKNYWRGKLISQPKPPKPQATKLEIRKTKIVKTEQRIKQCESKIRRYIKRLKKLNRSLSMLKRFISAEIACEGGL